MPKREKLTAEQRSESVIEDYKKAYKLVYGIYPSVVASGQYFRLNGQSSGVDLKRLKTMTAQLRNTHRAMDFTPVTEKSTGRPSRMFRM